MRGRIETVLDIARVDELRKGENPARWKGHLSVPYTVKSELAPVQHFNALPYKDISAFYLSLSEREAVSARVLGFLILTACRTGEVIGSTWSEIDMDAKL